MKSLEAELATTEKLIAKKIKHIQSRRLFKPKYWFNKFKAQIFIRYGAHPEQETGTGVDGQQASSQRRRKTSMLGKAVFIFITRSW